MFPGKIRPQGSCFQCSIDCLLYMFAIPFIKIAKRVLMIVWRCKTFLICRTNFLAADVHRYIEFFRACLFDCFLQGRAFFRSRGIAEHWLVFRRWYVEKSF